MTRPAQLTMTRRNNGILTALLAIVLLMASAACSRRPSGVMSKEDLAQLMADIHTGESVIQANSRKFPDDSTKRAFLQSIYAAHGVTREEVDSSLRWYGYNIERYMEVYDRTVEILKDRLEKAQDLAGSSADGLMEINTAMSGDSVDVWPGIRWRRFSKSMPNDMITFLLQSDQYWERGDVYTLRSKTLDNRGPVTYTITAEYGDGRMEYVTRTMSGDGWHDLQLVLDSARQAQKVYGVISYTPVNGEVAFIDSISLMRTRWGGHYRDQRQNVIKFENRTNRSSSTKSGSSSAPVADRPAEPLKIDNSRLVKFSAPDLKDAAPEKGGKLQEKPAMIPKPPKGPVPKPRQRP